MSITACVLKGFDSFEPDFSKQVFEQAGHGGGYLMHPSTMKHCRSFWKPKVPVSHSYEEWGKLASPDLLQLANIRYKEILANCPDMMLERDIYLELERYINKMEKAG